MPAKDCGVDKCIIRNQEGVSRANFKVKGGSVEKSSLRSMEEQRTYILKGCFLNSVAAKVRSFENFPPKLCDFAHSN